MGVVDADYHDEDVVRLHDVDRARQSALGTAANKSTATRAAPATPASPRSSFAGFMHLPPHNARRPHQQKEYEDEIVGDD